VSAVHLPHPFRDHPRVGETAREGFWVVALGVIAAFAFFAALGAFSPGDVLPVTILVAALVAAWCHHAWTGSHDLDAAHDPRLAHERERRGF
jgi:hypothetical protein